MPKSNREMSVTIKMTREEHDLVLRAAEHLWPDIKTTNSSKFLGMVLYGARAALRCDSPPKGQ